MSENEGRTVYTLDNIRHCKGFSGTGYTQQGLLFVATLDACHQLLDGLGLVARGRIGRH